MNNLFSDSIRRYVDLKIQGEPPLSEWSSIQSKSEARKEYYSELQAAKDKIDSTLFHLTRNVGC